MKYFAALLGALIFLFPIASPAAQKLVLTSTSATACTSVSAPARQLFSIVNASTSAQTATLSIYDESKSPTCASADLIYSVVLSASQVVNFPVLSDSIGGVLSYGLAYKLSASAANNIVIVYQ